MDLLVLGEVWQNAKGPHVSANDKQRRVRWDFRTTANSVFIVDVTQHTLSEVNDYSNCLTFSRDSAIHKGASKRLLGSSSSAYRPKFSSAPIAAAT